jgi:hypothetical protein
MNGKLKFFISFVVVSVILWGLIGIVRAEPPDAYSPPTTMYERKDNYLLFGGIKNPHKIAYYAVPAGYEIEVSNKLTPVDFTENTLRFSIPDEGEVVVTYTIGAYDAPDRVSVIVPDGWIAIPFDLMIEEETDAVILVTPYSGG